MVLLRALLEEEYPWPVTGDAAHAIVKVTRASIMGLMNAKNVTTTLINTKTENVNGAASIVRSLQSCSAEKWAISL